MIYMATCIMLLMRGDIHYEGKGKGVGPWKLILFLGPLKWHQADLGPTSQNVQGPTPSHLPK
jgi:hypothetical protein